MIQFPVKVKRGWVCKKNVLLSWWGVIKESLVLSTELIMQIGNRDDFVILTKGLGQGRMF